MKLSVMQENLARGLGVVSRAVSSRSTLPVLSNVLLRTEDAGLKLTATNLEIGITSWVAGKIDTRGHPDRPGAAVQRPRRRTAGRRADRSRGRGRTTLRIKAGRYQTQLRGIDAEEFPVIPSPGERPTTRVSQKELKRGAVRGRLCRGHRRGAADPDRRPDPAIGRQADARRGGQLPHRGAQPADPRSGRGHQPRGAGALVRRADARPDGHGRPGRHHARQLQEPGPVPRRRRRHRQPADRRSVPELPAGAAVVALDPCRRRARRAAQGGAHLGAHRQLGGQRRPAASSATRARARSPSPPRRMSARHRPTSRPQIEGDTVQISFNANTCRRRFRASTRSSSRSSSPGRCHRACCGRRRTTRTTSTSSCPSALRPDPGPATVHARAARGCGAEQRPESRDARQAPRTGHVPLVPGARRRISRWAAGRRRTQRHGQDEPARESRRARHWSLTPRLRSTAS